jgi:methionine sulfoxide reductase heme-binding subunit
MSPAGPWRLLKPLVVIGAFWPLGWLLAGLFGIADQTLGPNPVRELLHATGTYALNSLMFTLLISPLRDLTGQWQWLSVRRMLGLWAFAYALLHFLVYTILELDLDARDLLQEIARRPFILVGLASLLSLLPLALTSTDRMMRRLKKRWQQIHYLIYPATALAIWHFYWQVKADVLEPLIYLCALILLLTWRIAHRQSSNSH